MGRLTATLFLTIALLLSLAPSHSTAQQTVRRPMYASSSSGPFDPTTVSGCTLWLAGRFLTVADSTALAAQGPNAGWDNQGSAGGTFVAAGGGNSPVVLTNQLNGYRAVHYHQDASTDYSDHSSPASTFIGTGDYTVFAVFMVPTSEGSGSGAFIHGRFAEWAVYVDTSTNKVGVHHEAGGTNREVSFSRDIWYGLQVVYSGGSASVRLSDGATVSGALPAPAWVTSGGTRIIGASRVYAVYGWGRALNSTELQTVRDGIAGETGLTWN